MATIISKLPDGDSSILPRFPIAVLAGGASIELLGAAAACILAIVGLARPAPTRMTALAACALGSALAIHGLCVAARWRGVRRHLDLNRYESAAIRDSVAVEAVGGAVCAVLGALVLAGGLPPIALPVAAIAAGAATPFGGPAQPQLVELSIHPETTLQHLASRTLESSGGIAVLAGVAAVLLGILALAGIAAAGTATLVALLAVAGATALQGGALATRLASYGRAHLARPLGAS